MGKGLPQTRIQVLGLYHPWRAAPDILGIWQALAPHDAGPPGAIFGHPIASVSKGVSQKVKRLAVIGVSAGVGLALTIALLLGFFPWYQSRGKAKPWNSNAIKATYVGSQLRKIDKSNAGLLFYYDLENNTDSDYRFSDGPHVVIMSRLMSNNSLSSEQDVKLDYPVFLPARQRARIALGISHLFNWPAQTDPAFEDKFKDFVKQRVADVEAFVLFDETNRCQIEFPRGWQDLQMAATKQD